MAWRRLAARAILLDVAGNLLLQKGHDPYDLDRGSWYELPGGGIEPGEPSHEAVVRELWEEVGIGGVEVGPVVWIDRVQFSIGGWAIDQDNHYHLCRVSTLMPDIEPQGLEQLEVLYMQGARWLSLDELMADPLQSYPPRLRELAPALLAGDLPTAPIVLQGDPAPIG